MALNRVQRGRNGKTHTRTNCTDLGGSNKKNQAEQGSKEKGVVYEDPEAEEARV